MYALAAVEAVAGTPVLHKHSIILCTSDFLASHFPSTRPDFLLAIANVRATYFVFAAVPLYFRRLRPEVDNYN